MDQRLGNFLPAVYGVRLLVSPFIPSGHFAPIYAETGKLDRIYISNDDYARTKEMNAEQLAKFLGELKIVNSN